MGKRGKGKRQSERKQREDTDLDDDFDNYDPTDSEEEFGKDEKILLENRRGIKHHVEEEEVFGIHSSEEEDGEYYGDGVGSDMDSDIEGKGSDGDGEGALPDSTAWGKQTKQYYNTDYVDKDFGGMSKEEEELAEMEEQEASDIQRRLMSHMQETDFTLGLLDKVEEKKTELSSRADDADSSEKIIKDLSSMSKNEKIQLLRRESPELFQLIQDFKENMGLAQKKLLPVIKLVRSNEIERCAAAEFVHTLFSVIVNYSTNIVYYLLLKSKRSGPLDDHPVINRLYTYKKVMDEMLLVLEDKLIDQIDSILEQAEKNIPLEPASIEQSTELPAKNRAERRKRQLKVLEEAKRAEQLMERKKAKLEANKGEEPHDDVLSDLEQDVDLLQQEEEEETEDEEDAGKRGITYEMKKNKGLTARRKKEDRNPRVKNRNKYKKAVKRRKGQVRQPRTELERYGGELSGIKSYLTKSIKIKV